MNHLHSTYLRRLVACYERIGDSRAAAEALVTYGQPADCIHAAKRFLALGDLQRAGDAYLAGGQPHIALECFQRARAPEGQVRCLLALGNEIQAAILLLEHGKEHEALPLLLHALAQETNPVQQTTLRLHLARAFHLLNQPDQAHNYYRTACDSLECYTTTTRACAEAWYALGAWGETTGRQDRMQEGYAQALRLLDAAGETERYCEIAQRYYAAACACGNRQLVQMITVLSPSIHHDRQPQNAPASCKYTDIPPVQVR